MRLPGNSRPTQGGGDNSSEGNSTPNSVPSGNDNQLDEMLSSAIDTFLGSSRQTYEEFMQNFTQLTPADVSGPGLFGSADNNSTSGALSFDSVPSLPPSLLHRLRGNLATTLGDAPNRLGTSSDSVPDSNCSSASFGGLDNPSFADVPSEFPGRDEPPSAPPVIATGDDELEEEILDVGTASYSGVFSSNSSGRALQVDNFLEDEADNSDEEKVDGNSEKTRNRPLTNLSDDDVPPYQASFSQGPAKCTKLEKNQANQLQQSRDKAKKDSLNFTQQTLAKCSNAIANAEERLCSAMNSLGGPSTADSITAGTSNSLLEPSNDDINRRALESSSETPPSASNDSPRDTDDWLRGAFSNSHHNQIDHVPVRGQLRLCEEDLLDIIGDDLDEQEQGGVEDALGANCDTVDDTAVGQSGNLTRSVGVTAVFENKLNEHEDETGGKRSNHKYPSIGSDSRTFRTEMEEQFDSSESHDGLAQSVETNEATSAASVASFSSQTPGSSTTDNNLSTSDPQNGPQNAQQSRQQPCELITDAEIDKIMRRHSQLLESSDNEVDDESSPFVSDTTSHIADSQAEVTNDSDDDQVIYNSNLNSCNPGEVENEEGVAEDSGISVTHFRELNYSSKPQPTTEEPDSDDQAQAQSSSSSCLDTEPAILGDTPHEDEIQEFSLDEDFDYDNITLTPKYTPQEMQYLRSFMP